MDQIILLRPDGKPGARMPLTIYNELKDTIIEGFLFVPIANEEKIVEIATKKLGKKIEGNIAEYIAMLIPDFLANDYIEQVGDNNPVEYQLKLITC